jgi:hypothetical protein
MVIRFWADCQLIHVSCGGARIKIVRFHLSVADLADPQRFQDDSVNQRHSRPVIRQILLENSDESSRQHDLSHW